jgi:hypothetical protein
MIKRNSLLTSPHSLAFPVCKIALVFYLFRRYLKDYTRIGTWKSKGTWSKSSVKIPSICKKSTLFFSSSTECLIKIYFRGWKSKTIRPGVMEKKNLLNR